MKIEKIINLEKFIKILKNKKYNNKIQLEVEGKFLKTSNYLIIKKLVVPKKLLNQLGMEKIMIDGPTIKKPPRTSLKDMINDLGVNINKRLDIIESDLNGLKSDVNGLKIDISAIKSLPTIQKELEAQKSAKK